MTLNGDAKFKGKLTRGLKNDINLVNFHASSQNLENLHFLTGPFCPKHIKF